LIREGSRVHDLGPILALLAAVAAVATLARRIGGSAPILLVVIGLLASFVPGVPSYELDPEIVLVLFLPPLLYSAALNSSYIDFRANLRPIGLLSVGLVLFTTVFVGLIAYAIVPGLTLPAAFALGAIVAPPDAVAATAVARRVGLPRRVVTVLEGESLVNDATALTAYSIAIAAAVSGSFSYPALGMRFLEAVVGGLVVGLVVAWLIGRLRRYLSDPPVENTLSLITPFLAFLPAEAIHGSGVVAVVVTGLYLGHRAPSLQSSATRLQNIAIWRMIDFLLQGVVFALIGLQLRTVLESLEDDDLGVGELIWYGAAVTAAVVVLRFVWVFPATYLARLVSRRVRERDGWPPWQIPTVISWAAMRGVVSLAAAFAIPVQTDTGEPFPGRDLLLFLTFAVIFGTLVLQGLTLPAVIRRLGVRADEAGDRLSEAAAVQQVVGAGLARLEEVTGPDGAGTPNPPDGSADAGDGRANGGRAVREVPEGVMERPRDKAEIRRLSAWERLGSRSTGRETPSEAYTRLRSVMLDAERTRLVELRDSGRIDDEILRRVQRDLDLEESLLSREQP